MKEDKKLAHDGKGSYQEREFGENNSKVTLVRWFDNRGVNLVSTFAFEHQPPDNNEQLLYRKDCEQLTIPKKELLQLAPFKLNVAVSLMKAEQACQSVKRGRPSREEPPKLNKRKCSTSPDEVRLDKVAHVPFVAAKLIELPILMASRTAWVSPPDDEWTPEQLGDQFNKAIYLNGTNPEEQQQCSDINAFEEDHNSDLHSAEHGNKSEPYKNKYEARLMLLEIKSVLLKELVKLHSDDHSQGLAKHLQEQLQAVHYQLGMVAISVEEPSTGEEHFTTIIHTLKECVLEPQCINLLIASHNQLGLLWGGRFEHARAKKELLLASELYKNYKELNQNVAPLPINDLFLKRKNEFPGEKSGQCSSEGAIITVADEGECHSEVQACDGGWEEFEKYHTYTLFYLAQICGQLGETEDAAHFCHATLHRQLADSVVFEPLEWSKNAANLSLFYSSNGNYKLACYLLSAAWCVISSNPPTQDSSRAWKLRHNCTKADVAVIIGKYCVKVLQDSEAALENDPQQEGTTANEADVSTGDEQEQKRFTGLNEEVLDSLLCRLPSKLVRDYEGARGAFLIGLEFLEKATSYYTLEDHASLHTEAVQSISRLYQGLAVFEPHADRQSKMHKRRVDMLTHLLHELNPQYYLQVCRQLRYELAEACAKMASCKEPPSDAAPGALTPAQWAKITSLNMTSIEHFKLFLRTFEDSDGCPPSRYPSEAERAAVVAFFYMGRLWNKMRSTGRDQAVLHISNAIQCFKVLDYVERNPECRPKLTDELELCEELVQLLPLKLAQLQ
ncbi:KIF-1 binding protein [Trinorchestia longiramus]|nr:KIF-1 binding protein [Trinorchestia longiramus]